MCELHDDKPFEIGKEIEEGIEVSKEMHEELSNGKGDDEDE